MLGTLVKEFCEWYRGHTERKVKDEGVCLCVRVRVVVGCKGIVKRYETSAYQRNEGGAIFALW